MKTKLEQIGKEAVIKTENGLSIIVIILDYKSSYGRDRWLVKPKEGSGETWVQNLEVVEKSEKKSGKK
jgi:hypothetical protein